MAGHPNLGSEWVGGKFYGPDIQVFWIYFINCPDENVGFDILQRFIFQMFEGFSSDLARQVLDVSQNKLETISAEHLKGRPSGEFWGLVALRTKTRGFSESLPVVSSKGRSKV